MVWMQRFFALKDIWYHGTDAEIFCAKGDLVPWYGCRNTVFCAKGDDPFQKSFSHSKCSSHEIVSLKLKIKNLPGLQFITSDRMSLVSPPVH
jgi:hypothetical protein